MSPDLVFYLSVEPDTLLHRTLVKYGGLDYWESGMDICLSSDMLDSFLKYQARLKGEFDQLAGEYEFDVVNGEQNPDEIQMYLREKVSGIL